MIRLDKYKFFVLMAFDYVGVVKKLLLQVSYRSTFIYFYTFSRHNTWVWLDLRKRGLWLVYPHILILYTYSGLVKYIANFL